MNAYPCVTAATRGGDRPPDRPQRSPYRLAALGILLACVGAVGVATVARAQTESPPVFGPPPFARDGLTRETAPTLYGPRRMATARWGSSPKTEEAGTVSTSWQPLSLVLVVAAGAAPRRQAGRPTLAGGHRGKEDT